MILALSPHLDDAVLSCPAFLTQHAPAARIATVFTQGEPDELYRQRRAEDREAARALGCAVTHLRFRDAPFRLAHCNGFESLIFGPEDDCLDLVAHAIGRLVRRYRPTRVLAPLGVGNHVDHRLVRDAALAAVSHARLLFYEDRPYAFVDEQVDHALGRTRMENQPAAFWKQYVEQVTYVRTYLGDVMSAASLAAAWRDVPRFPHPLELSVETAPTEAFQAIRAYRSQIPDLFANSAELESQYRNRPERLYRITMK